MGVSVCLRVRVCPPRSYLRNYPSDLHQIFLRLLAVFWPSARDDHVLACSVAKYSPILFFFIHRLSNKSCLIWLLTTPTHVKYVPTLPCNLSLMAFLLTLMFHKVV